MNEEDDIAKALLGAQKIHEENYQTGAGDEFGEYTKGWKECLIAAGDEFDLSPNLWSLLSLGMPWCNDTHDWVTDVLAGKTIDRKG